MNTEFTEFTCPRCGGRLALIPPYGENKDIIVICLDCDYVEKMQWHPLRGAS